MRSPAKLLGIFLLAPLLDPGSLAAADKPKPGTTVREEARVTLVEIPVNVLDRNGRPVEGLTKDDFEVFDDGKKQAITGFEVLDERKSIAPPGPGDLQVN